MKGIVFTEFMDMVAEVFSEDILEEVIELSDLPNDGAYTAVGTYSHQEIVRMTTHLSQLVDLPVSSLLEAFGQHLFGRFYQKYPVFFEITRTPFSFLQNVDSYIHVEVKKLYPDAELPRFYCDLQSENHLTMYYLSSRHFEDLAIGLIKGCLAHFNTDAEVTKKPGAFKGQDAIEIHIVLTNKA
ncbi:heme NO-binding domain-containing protein [Paraglaciecola aestuariivivens]